MKLQRNSPAYPPSDLATAGRSGRLTGRSHATCTPDSAAFNLIAIRQPDFTKRNFHRVVQRRPIAAVVNGGIHFVPLATRRQVAAFQAGKKRNCELFLIRPPRLAVHCAIQSEPMRGLRVSALTSDLLPFQWRGAAN